MERDVAIWRQHLAVIEPDSKVVDRCIEYMQALLTTANNLVDDTMWQALCQLPECTEEQLSHYLDKTAFVRQRSHSIDSIEVKDYLDKPKVKQIVEQYVLFQGYENVEIATLIPTYLALAEEVLRLKTATEASYNAASLEDRACYATTLRFLQQQYMSLIAYKENLLENVLLRLESLAKLGAVAKPLAAYATFYGVKLPIVSHGYLPLDNWQVSHFLDFYRLLSTHATGEQARRLAAIDWQLGHLYYRDDGVLVLCPHLYQSSDLYLQRPWFSSVFTGKRVLYDLFTNPYNLLQLHKAIDVVEQQTAQPDDIMTLMQQSYTALEHVVIEKKRVETAINGLWWIFSAHPIQVAHRWINHLTTKRIQILQSLSVAYAKILDNPMLCSQLLQSDLGIKLASLAADCEVEKVSMIRYMPDTMAQSLTNHIGRSFCLLLLDKSSNAHESVDYLDHIFSASHAPNIIAIIGREAYAKYRYAYTVIKQLSVSNYADMVEVIDYLTDSFDVSAILASFDTRFSEVGSASFVLHQAALNYLYSIQRKRSSWVFQSIKSLVPPLIGEKLRMPAIQPYIADRMPTTSTLDTIFGDEGQMGLSAIPNVDTLRYENFICPKSSKYLQDVITQYVGKSPKYSKELSTVILSYGSLDAGIDYIFTFVLQKMDAGKSITSALQDFPIVRLATHYRAILDEVYTMLDQYIVSELERAVVENDETICGHIRQWMHEMPCTQSGDPLVSGWQSILPDILGSTWSTLRADIMWEFGHKVDKAQYNLRWLPVILYSNTDHPIDEMVKFYSDKQSRYRYWWSCFGGDSVASSSLSSYSNHVLQQSMVSRASADMMHLLFSDPTLVTYYKLSECEAAYQEVKPRWQQQQDLVDDIQTVYQAIDTDKARTALARVVSHIACEPEASESIAAYKHLGPVLWQHIATQVKQAMVQGEIIPLALYADLLEQLAGLPIQAGSISKQYAFLSWLSSVSAYISTASIKVAYGVEHNQPISSWLNSLTLYLLVIDVYPDNLRQHMIKRLDLYTGMVHTEGLLSFWEQQMLECSVSDDPFYLGDRLTHTMEQHLGSMEQDKPCQGIYAHLLSECEHLTHQYGHHSLSFTDRRFLETSINTLAVITPQMQDPQKADCLALQQRMTKLLQRPYIAIENKSSVAIHASLFFHPTTTKELSRCQHVNHPQH